MPGFPLPPLRGWIVSSVSSAYAQNCADGQVNRAQLHGRRFHSQGRQFWRKYDLPNGDSVDVMEDGRVIFYNWVPERVGLGEVLHNHDISDSPVGKALRLAMGMDAFLMDLEKTL